MRRLALLALLGAAPVWAQDRPATAPTRDVDVVYRAGGSGKAVEQRSRFEAAEQKLRIDPPTSGFYLILDRRARRMDIVSDAERSVVEIPYDPARVVAGVATGPNFTRVGSDVVAGLACTEWQTVDSAGRGVTVCFTEDGVLTRARIGRAVLVQAMLVSYGPIDPTLFAIPGGYRRVAASERGR